MKKLLLSVIAFALITTSCNKYKDDFKNLNARLDALSAQVAGVNTLVAGLSGLSAQITSLQTAVAGLPTNATLTAALAPLSSGLAALTTQVSTISTALNTLATNVAAGNVTTQGLINQLITQTTANQAATLALINSVNTQLAAAISAGNAALTATLTTQLAAATAANAAAIAAAQAALTADNATQTASLAALIAALQASLNTANLNIQLLLNNQNVYESPSGIFKITNEAELTFAEGLQNRVNLIKSDVEIDVTGFSASQKNRTTVVTNKIFAILGYMEYDGAGTSFNNLGSVSDYVHLDVSGSINLPALTSVGDDYDVDGADVNDPVLATVGDDYELNYEGAYESTSLTTVGDNVRLVNDPNSDGDGTTSINFPNLSSANRWYENSGNQPDFPDATSINIGAGDFFNLQAIKATSVILGQHRFELSNGVNINAPLATLVNIAADSSWDGDFTVIAKAGSSVLLPNLKAIGEDGSQLNITGPATQSLPQYTDGKINSTTIKTLTAAKYKGFQSFDGLTVLEHLTLGAIEAGIFGISTTLITINATGKIAPTGDTPAPAGINLGDAISYPDLTTITLGGEWDYVWLNMSFGADVLSSITTSVGSIINSFSIIGADELTSMTLNHKHHVGGPGSWLLVTGNPELTTLTSSSDFARKIEVTNNGKLATIDFSSYQNALLGGTLGSITIIVKNNATTGTYTKAIEGTLTTAYVLTKFTSAYIGTLKGYIRKHRGVGTTTANTTAALLTDQGYTSGNINSAPAVNSAFDITVDNVGTVLSPLSLENAILFANDPYLRSSSNGYTYNAPNFATVVAGRINNKFLLDLHN